MLDRYDDSPGPRNAAEGMQIEELLAYLKSIEDFRQPPWMAVLHQTDAIGDPAVPSWEHTAVMRWVGQALETWEKQFPLEEPLAEEVRRLKPLVAAVALLDPLFLQPGAHPLHQLLDSIQARAIGWQARLDRVGAILQQQVLRAIDASRDWFDDHTIDLARIHAEFYAAVERDQSRAERMVQRVVEAELGKVKTAAAKKTAAAMLNAALEKFPVPEEISEFVKGPWYTSAQLLLLKFGTESEQWQSMSTTTEALLDSLQSLENANEERRQYIFEAVTQLPKEMRRWLLSLHHDTEAVNEAMGLVEFAHLRILRRQTITLEYATPIHVPSSGGEKNTKHAPEVSTQWVPGQWFSIESAHEGAVRVQLVLVEEQEQQLLFTNLAGIKVLQLSFEDFSNLIENNKVELLHSGASFSLCLAHVAGIKSVEMLDALLQAQPELAIPRPELEQPGELDFQDAAPAYQSTEPAGETEVGRSWATPKSEPPGTATPPSAAPEAAEPVGEVLTNTAHGGDEGAATTTAADPDEAANGIGSTRDAETPLPDEDGEEEHGLGYLVDQVDRIMARGGFNSAKPKTTEAPTGAAAPTTPELSSERGYLTEQAAAGNTPLETPSPAQEKATHPIAESSPPGGPATESAESPRPAAQDTSAPERGGELDISLPMGTWLGFHDGDMPLMAKLAVHDPIEDYYIFVNRKGLKLRQLSGEQLLKLVEDGQVDILETRSNFRAEVSQALKNLDQE